MDCVHKLFTPLRRKDVCVNTCANKLLIQALESSPVVFLVMSPHLQFCQPLYFLSWKFEVSWLTNAYVDSQKLDAVLHVPCNYYSSAAVPKWPRSNLTASNLISWGSMPSDPPSLACLCMHTYTSDTHITTF